MEKIITDDGSITFRNPAHGQPYHTQSGAVQEAIEKHARCMDLSKDSLVIIDYCSGLAYSTAAAVDILNNVGKDATIYLLENDINILTEILNVEAPFLCWKDIQKFTSDFIATGKAEGQIGNCRLILIFGNARETIKSIPKNLDHVFFAPFSPTRQPEMWTMQIFEDIFTRMNPGGRLTTYSYAKHVREALQEAGFALDDGPVIGRRSPSTIAVKKPIEKESNRLVSSQDVKNYLASNGISFKEFFHPPVYTCEEAKKYSLGMNGIAAKNLFFKGKKSKEFFLLLLPESKKANIKEVEAFVLDKLTFANEQDLMVKLGLIAGSVSPFGILNDKEKVVKLIIDEDIWNAKIVSFHPNVNTETLELAGKDFQKFVELRGNKVVIIKA